MTNRNRVRLSQLSLGLAIALAAAPAFAQQTSASVGGRIVSADSAPVDGAVVTIVHEPSGTARTALTDAEGRYTARGLRVGGPYTITIDKDGATEVREGVYLQLSETTSVDATLGQAATTLEVVEVTGATVASDVFTPTKMGSGTSVDERTIRSLPTTGNIQDFMRLDPRVAFTDRASGSMTAGGMNPRFNRIAIDGVSASDTFGLEGNNMPTARQPVSMEAIEAIDISLSSYDVTLSGAAGANINAVTKSGGNEYHGSVYGYYRDGDWFGEHPLTGADFSEFTDEQTYGATFGGPMIKDRLYFFVNYENYVRGKPSPDLASTPLMRADGDFDADDLAAVQDIFRDVWGIEPGETTGNGDTEIEEYAVKFDWNITDFHRASLRYSNLEQTKVRPEGSGPTTLSLSSNWYDHEKSVESVVGQLFSDWTENFSTEFKASYRDYSAIRITPTTAPAIQVYFDDLDATTAPTSGDFIRLGTERSSMGNALATETWDFFGAGTLSLGDHDLKAGIEYSDNDIYNYFLQDAWGNYSFYVPRVGGVANFSNLVNGYYFDYDLNYQTSPGSVPAEYTNKNLGFFIQDTWYVNSNLTLTFGLRADKPSTSPDPEFNQAFADPQTIQNTATGPVWTGGFGYDNSNTFNGDYIIQPRFGFNYNFDSERPTQIRGGVGLFQGDAPQVWVSNSYQSTGLNYISYTNYRHCLYTGPVSGANAVCLANDFNPDGLDPTIPPSAAANRNVNVIAPDFELPSVWKANLAFDHELPWGGVVFSAEVLLSEIENGLFYRTLNVGPGFTGPDGRTLYWNPQSIRPFGNTTAGPANTPLEANRARWGNNGAYGDVYLLENTDEGSGQQLTVSLSKPFTEGSDWSWSFGYTYTNAEEVSALTSSTAGSGYGSQYGFSINEPESTTARYEIKDRFSGALNWSHAFFGDYQTQVGLFYEGRSGRPYSYIFTGDANGDNRTFNDLFYVPDGPDDVLFGSINATGQFTADDAMRTAFFSWLSDNPELARYAGTYAPENGFRAGWVNTFDLRISQELPGFFKGHKSKIWMDIFNVGNLLNSDWGHVLDYGFNGNQAVAQLVGIHDGQYVYGYRTRNPVPEFGQESALAVPTDADQQTNGISQWSIQLGFKYEF